MDASEEQIDYFLKAAVHGDVMILEELAKELDNGKGLLHTFTRVKDEDGRTALHFAAAAGRMGICGYLISFIKVDVNLKDGNGDTPLHLAVSFNHLPVVTMLIENGANVMLSTSRGYTPLHCAAESGNTEIMELLISKGAAINSVSDSGTPLHWAAAKGKRETVKLLLDHNADPNIVSHDLYTPLVTAIIAGFVECVELLLKGGADPNLHALGLTPLGYAAAAGGMTKVVKCLLEAGADPNAIDTSGLAPLECAAVRGDLETVKVLFPLTSRLQSCPDWSIPGIMKKMSSKEVKAQLEEKRKEFFQESKSKAEEAFKKKEYVNAIFWYEKAKDGNPDDATLYSNISLCWSIMNEGDRALSQALDCAKLRPEWPKAHYRVGAAYKILKNYTVAAEAFRKALKLDPENKELERAFKEALKLDSAKK